MASLFPPFKKDATATRPERNLAVCAYGARTMLSMLWEGSTGETRREMSEVLRLNADPNSHGNRYERLGRPLGLQWEMERRGLEMLTANSLW